MPALVLFGRRTLIGGDDLVWPAMATILLRLCQLVCFMLPLTYQLYLDANGKVLDYLLIDPAGDACLHSHFFPLTVWMFLSSAFLFCTSSMLLEYKIFHWACQGSPTQVQPRTRHLEHLFELKMVVFTVILCLVVMTAICATVFAPTYIDCKASQQGETSSYGKSRVGSHSWWIGYALFLLTLMGEAMLKILFILRICCKQPTSTEPPSQYNDYHHQNVERLWEQRCSLLCSCLGMSTCFLFGGRELSTGSSSSGQTHYEAVARALSDFTESRGVLDIVPTDLAAGLLVLQRVQRQRVLESRLMLLNETIRMEQRNAFRSSPPNEYISQPQTSKTLRSRMSSSDLKQSSSSDSNSPETALLTSSRATSTTTLKISLDEVEQQTMKNPLHPTTDALIIQEGAHFARYSLAIYTWMLYIYAHPFTGCARLSCQSCSKCLHREQESSASPVEEAGTIIGDNICGWHKHSLLLTAGLKEADLVYAQFFNSYSISPYAILLDHETRSVVVTVRGTLSLEDLVTDVLISPESLEALGEEFGFDGTGQFCHGGVFGVTQNLYQDLIRHGHLHRLLRSEDAQYPDYTLRLVGHSLGASVCTLLSFMLKRDYPSVQVHGYSPAGCTLTWPMATICKDWVHTFVLDSDIVPRLSVDSLEHLRDETLKLIGQIKVPKYKVAQLVVTGGGNSEGGPPILSVTRLLGLGDHGHQDLEELRSWTKAVLYEEREIPDTEYGLQLNEFFQIQSERKAQRDHRHIKMYPPGKIVHLVKTGERFTCLSGAKKLATCCMSNSGFTYSPVFIENDALPEVQVAPTMATDHFVDRMCNELEAIARDYGILNNSHPEV